MQEKLLKKVFIIAFLLCSVFLHIDNLKATDFCDTSNKMLCEYIITETNGQVLKVTYTIDSNEHFKSTISNPLPAVWKVNQNFNIGQFKSNNKYVCLEKIYWTTISSGASRVTTYDLIKEKQGNDTRVVQPANLSDSCNTFTENFEQQDISCGIYGKMNVYAKKANNTFAYSGTYTGSINGNSVTFNVPGNGFKVSGKIESNGCPEKVCYTCNAGVKQCYQSESCYNKSGEIQDADDIKKSQEDFGINPGDGIAATLGNAFDIATGAISCQELLNTGEGAESTVLDILHKVFSIIKIAAIAILLVFTAIDFVSAIAKSDGDAIKDATKNLPKRLILAFLIFILPSIIELILTIISLNNGSCNF